MLDLYNKKYDRQTLKDNIYSVKLIDILKTQKLDLKFIIKYILSDLYQLHDDDKTINYETVLKFQTHIKKEELLDAFLIYNSDDDSIEDFQTYIEKNPK